MKYTAITIQGNILTSEVLEKIRVDDISHQKPTDFGLAPNASLRDEINMAWSVAVNNWSVFTQKRNQLQDTDSGVTETRRFWVLPLLTNLGYDVSTATAEMINGKSYAISHRATNKDGYPIHIIGCQQHLEFRPLTGGTRMSAHALVQEYLNNNEHLYALVTNGKLLRLIRDATRLSRLSYIEWDVEQIMEQGLYAEFALLYRALHASRMPVAQADGSNSIIEYYHQEALASGSRIRERLSKAVENSLRQLADGLLKQPGNQALIAAFTAKQITSKEYYLYNLRLVYRMLFLMVIEDRKLIYPEKLPPDQAQLKDIYYNYYSLQRLAKLAESQAYIDAHKSDLWQSLLTTFAVFENPKYAQPLGIVALGSGLFAPDALGIISQLQLNNETLLQVIRYLVSFENDNQQLVHVNYADLDVEEFGSVYEGLLEYSPEVQGLDGSLPTFVFAKGNSRSASGSHYTPEELVKPLIKHSLDYLIADKLKEPNPEAALLSLTVCDVACGSGHILLSAARRIGYELAKLRSCADQPTPAALRTAIRDVIRHCIYGVDLNPLAVELCKVALWLEAHEPGAPLNFLDHHIKCGNAIVGLAHKTELENGIATEAFKALPGDDKDVVAAYSKQNKKEKQEHKALLSNLFDDVIDNEMNTVLEKYGVFKNLPETDATQTNAKAKQYEKYESSTQRIRLKQLADGQVAQFFILKTNATKDYLLTDKMYRDYLRNANKGMGPIQSQGLAYAETLYHTKKFFHWFLEFPDVMEKGGFDCILGNPPFLGGQKLSGNYGEQFLECIKYQFAPIGAVDLVTYFFRRIFTLLNNNGFLSLISTNTIAQGRAREDGLDIIIQNGGTINHAIKSMKWPGLAAVEVALLSITKQAWQKEFVLAGKNVATITPYLDDAVTLGNPKVLFANQGKSFQGSIVLGKGFVLEPKEALALIAKDPKNKDVIFPYLNGDDLNNNPDQSASRYVINFFDWPIEKAMEYEECFNIIEERVKPERIVMKRDRGAEFWWQFLRIRKELYSTIFGMEKVIVLPRVTKYPTFSFIENNYIYHDKNIVLSFNRVIEFSVLQSAIHDDWSRKYSPTLGGMNNLSYSPNTCFETFPFPQNLTPNQEQSLEQIGEQYHSHRQQLMLGLQLGLTKTYNAFHSKEVNSEQLIVNSGATTTKVGKQMELLQKHLAKTANTISLADAIAGITQLRALHTQMDDAVLAAYGWQDVPLLHNFYEVDYLPENDRIRYTIHPDARKEILKRLLELNHIVHQQEVADGLWDKKKVGKKKVVDEGQRELF